MAFEYTRVEPPLTSISHPGRYPAMLPNQRTPVGELRCVFYSQVCRVLLQAAFGDRFVPTLKLANDAVLGDAGRTNEPGARRGSAQFSGDFPNGPQDPRLYRIFRLVNSDSKGLTVRSAISPRPTWPGSGCTCFCATEHETNRASHDTAALTQACSCLEVAACSGMSGWPIAQRACSLSCS